MEGKKPVLFHRKKVAFVVVVVVKIAPSILNINLSLSYPLNSYLLDYSKNKTSTCIVNSSSSERISIDKSVKITFFSCKLSKFKGKMQKVFFSSSLNN